MLARFLKCDVVSHAPSSSPTSLLQFDYGESQPCLNERANSNAWIQPHTHDNQWTAWDANLGCKDVAYTLSLVA